MSLKKITDKNFLPSHGVKPIPVYSEFFNDLLDAAWTLNARAHHSMSQTNLPKHPLMAVAVYDFAVNGGDTGADMSLNGGIGFFPDNAIIQNVSYDIVTTLRSLATAATATMIVKVPTDGTLLTLLIPTGATGGGKTGMGLGTPVSSSAGTWIKTTAARGITVEATGNSDITAGKVFFFIEYVTSELIESDLSPL